MKKIKNNSKKLKKDYDNENCTSSNDSDSPNQKPKRYLTGASGARNLTEDEEQQDYADWLHSM